MKNGLIFIINVFFALSVSFIVQGCNPKAYSKNIIIVSLDTLRADHLGCYDYTRPTSPNIDHLARNGIKFSKVFSQSSWTLPSHMSFFTSRYPSFHKVMTTDNTLNPGIKTLAEFFKEHGYSTAAFTEGGNLFRIYGFGRGFDIYGEKSRNIDVTFNQAFQWLKQRKNGERFLLFIHTYEIHTPYLRTELANAQKRGRLTETLKVGSTLYDIMYGRLQLTEEEKDYIRSLYDSGILYADRFIGKLILLLRKLKLMDTTTLVLFSDHGEDLWDHSISPAHGITLYQDQLHVPLIIYDKSLPSPKEINTPVELIDVMPTLLAMHNIKIPAELQGKNLLPLITRGTSPAKRFIFSEGTDYGPNRIAVIENGFKYIIIPQPSKVKRNITIQKLHSLEKGLAVQSLFNLNEDPLEQKNIFYKESARAEKLRQIIEDEYIAKSRDIFEINGVQALMADQIERLRSLGYVK